MNYYIYAYIRKSNGTPYYIGKGKSYRAYSKHGKIPVPNNRSRIVLLETNLTELGAFALERRLIKWWGRKDLNTGLLLNRTDGGEGFSGLKFTDEHKAKLKRVMLEETKRKISKCNKGKITSKETKKKISEKLKGKPRSEETKKRLTGILRSEETKIKMKEAKLGKIRKPFSEETKIKMKEAQRLRRNKEINGN